MGAQRSGFAPKNHNPREYQPQSESSDHVLLLVQDWLAQTHFPLTLECLINECNAYNRKPPSADTWYYMTAQLELSSFTNQGTKDNRQQLGKVPLLETVVAYTLAMRRKETEVKRSQSQSQQQPTILMSKKPLAKETKNGSRACIQSDCSSTSVLHGVSSHNSISNRTQSRKVGELAPALSLRPKSAVICKSTSDLIAKSVLGSDSIGNDQSDLATVRKKSRPISATSALPSTTQDDRARSPSKTTIKMTQIPSMKEIELSSAHRSTSISIAALSQAIEDKEEKEVDTGTNLVGNDDDEESGEGGYNRIQLPALELEGMSEDRLLAQFSSLSKGTIKKLRRVLAKSNACSQEFDKSKRTIDKIHTRAKIRQLRRVIAAEQTPLLSSTMDKLTKEPCSLCQHVFLKKNLAMKVSYKSIYDLRASWTQKNKIEQQEVENGQRGVGNNIDELKHGQPELHDADCLDEMGRVQVTRFYDEVPICVFCSQLVFNFSSYRPSSAELRIRQAEQKHIESEKKKYLEAERLQNLQRCDPLDFHSYELNSDDSDMEEIIECGVDGRPHVVRRKRPIRNRVPAKLGLVSSRLHYDKLRTQSIRALNNKEWDVIIRTTQER